MLFGIGRPKAAQGLTPAVSSLLTSQYRVDAALASQWKMAEKKGVYAGRGVKHLRIFDPAQVPTGNSPPPNYDALNDHRAALRFEGHIEKDGAIILTDRRASRPAA